MILIPNIHYVLISSEVSITQNIKKTEMKLNYTFFNINLLILYIFYTIYLHIYIHSYLIIPIYKQFYFIIIVFNMNHLFNDFECMVLNLKVT